FIFELSQIVVGYSFINYVLLDIRCFVFVCEVKSALIIEVILLFHHEFYI
ncbi:hypothetical protein NPIL_618281, partial [Nephila pilipes]